MLNIGKKTALEIYTFILFPANILESFRKKQKKNESIKKPLFSSTEEDHFLACYLGSLTFMVYFANTENYKLCGKGKCI